MTVSGLSTAESADIRRVWEISILSSVGACGQSVDGRGLEKPMYVRIDVEKEANLIVLP